MPNKDGRVNADNKVAVTNTQHVTTAKAMGSTPKAAAPKVGLKETAMSPPPVTPVTAEADGTELLGSLTTQQQQRTSARVIKKLMLEPQVEREKRDTECETPMKVEEKELNFPTVKQRMPKALWSADEKNFFFEALNEYGKDFDAVTAYICAKMKKKGMPDLNMKTKTQVSHFYYRTWHKLSKYIQFEENVKKVSQELYALINYGELRKKLVSVNEKTCSRLGELVLCGSMMVRHRGRNVRVRTPMCRALRKLNQITEGASGARVCGRAHVTLRARNVGAWTRVQAVAHNPRAALLAPLRTSLAALIRALAHRWAAHPSKKKKSPENIETKNNEDIQKSIEESPISEAQGKSVTENGEEKNDLEGHLNLEPDRIVHQELKLPKKPVLHLGPRPDAEINLPIISPSEPLSSQKICFNSYLERMRGKDIREKIRTPKRQRKDSTTDKDKENESKKPKMEETEKLICIDDVAIDGIELMANYKNSQEDEVHASTEDEKEVKSEETADEATEPPERDRDISEIDKDMSEREKDSFSEMEDDEKFNKSDTDNESDQGKINKGQKEQIFRNLKVKFRIRPKKRGGNVYTVVTTEKDLVESKVVDVKIEGSKVEDSKADEHKEEESKRDEDIETAIKQIRRGWSVYDSGDLTIGDLYLMFGSRSKLELDYWWAEATPPYHPHRDHRDGKDRQRVEPGADETDADLFSPKTVLGQDSNDDIPSGDEKKGEHVASPESKMPSSGSATFRLTSKLINRPLPPAPAITEPGFAQLTERLKRLLSMVGNPHVAATNAARCDCGHVCSTQRKPKQQVAGSYPAPDEAPLFRHPTPIAPKGQLEPMCPELNLSSVPRWRRGRPRADQRVVVQRLLPLLPKLPPPSNLIPVNIVTPGHPQPPRILPKPTPSPAHDSPYFYAMSESNDQLFVQDGDRKIPLRPQEEAEKPDKDNPSKAMHDNKSGDSGDSKKSDLKSAPSTSTRTTDRQTDSEFLGQESMSLSPSRLLRDADGWLEGSVHDFSLSSFLGHLEGRPHQDQVDSQLQSLLAESSVDYVAKFADLAANVDTLVADDDLK